MGATEFRVTECNRAGIRPNCTRRQSFV
jgi:hypothetical protein